jgi:hypothetical protein
MDKHMTDRIRQILNAHVTKHPGTKIIKVTSTHYYGIPGYSSEDPKDLIEEWFSKYPISRSHAYRDGSLLISHFNEDASIITIE